MERTFSVRNSRKITSRVCHWKSVSRTSKQAAFHSTIFEKFRFAFHGNSSSGWNSSRFARYPVPQLQIPEFHGSSFLGYWVPVSGFPVLGPATFAEVLPCTFLHSRFSAVSNVGDVLVEWKARTELVHNGWLCFKILWLRKTRRIVE